MTGKARFSGNAAAGDKIVYVTGPLPEPPEAPRQLPLDLNSFTGRTELITRLERFPRKRSPDERAADQQTP